MCTFDKMKKEEKIQTDYYPTDGFKEGATYYHSGKYIIIYILQINENKIKLLL